MGPTGPIGPSGPTGPAGNGGGVGPPGDKGLTGNNGIGGTLGEEGLQGPLAPFKIKYYNCDPNRDETVIVFEYADRHTLFVLNVTDPVTVPAGVTTKIINVRFVPSPTLIPDTNFWIQFKPWNTTTNPNLNIIFKVTPRAVSEYASYSTYPANVTLFGSPVEFTGVSYLYYSGPVNRFKIC